MIETDGEREREIEREPSHQLDYADTGCSLKVLLGAMDDRDGW